MAHYGGTQKITFGSPGGRDTDYEAKRAAAQAQAAFLDLGIDAADAVGAGDTFMAPHKSQTYGNVNHTVADVIQGDPSNFAYEDTGFNMPLHNPQKQTGVYEPSQGIANSSSLDPQVDPSSLGESALMSRIARMAEQGNINLNAPSVFNLS